MRFCLRAIGLSTIALAAACAHRPANQAEVDQLNRSIESLRLQNSAYAKQVEELENRVFILSDRLESTMVNEERVEAPRLPTIALRPSDEPGSLLPVATPGTETEAEPVVEYVGEAAKTTTRRPVLRLHGDTGELTVSRPASPRPVLRVLREGSPRPTKEEHPDAIVLYRKSYDALRTGQHEEAVQGFRELIRRYPSHDLADNSQYWLGECYYDRKDYPQAVREFRRVIEHYPNGNKVPDALLKVGFSYMALGSAEAGRQTLSQLERSYPRHEAAVLAAARLAEMDRSHSARPPGESARTAASAAKGSRTSEEAP